MGGLKKPWGVSINQSSASLLVLRSFHRVFGGCLLFFFPFNIYPQNVCSQKCHLIFHSSEGAQRFLTPLLRMGSLGGTPRACPVSPVAAHEAGCCTDMGGWWWQQSPSPWAGLLCLIVLFNLISGDLMINLRVNVEWWLGWFNLFSACTLAQHTAFPAVAGLQNALVCLRPSATSTTNRCLYPWFSWAFLPANHGQGI